MAAPGHCMRQCGHHQWDSVVQFTNMVNMCTYVRSSARWSDRYKSFQFIPLRPIHFPEYREGCTYFGIHISYLLYAEELVLMAESSTGLRHWAHAWAGKLLYGVAVVSEYLANEGRRLQWTICLWIKSIFHFRNWPPTTRTLNHLGVILSNSNDRIGESYGNKQGKTSCDIHNSQSGP